jgi:hypothetical protein
VLSRVDEEGVVHAEHPFPLDLRPGQFPQHRQAGLVQGREREGTLGEQAIETALITALVDEQAVHAVHGLVLGDDQPTDVAFEFDQSFGREDLVKLRRIVLDQFRKLDQREQGDLRL